MAFDFQHETIFVYKVVTPIEEEERFLIAFRSAFTEVYSQLDAGKLIDGFVREGANQYVVMKPDKLWLVGEAISHAKDLWKPAINHRTQPSEN